MEKTIFEQYPDPPPCADDRELQLHTLPVPLDWAALFGTDAPVEIEIGSGKGRFLIRSAGGHPERNYLGIERSLKFFRLLKQRVQQAELGNVRVLRAEADHFLRTYVPRASVSALYVLFPDPWPKKRHRKRRLVNDAFMALVAEVLVPGGTITLATDFDDYFEQMLAVGRACAGMDEKLVRTIRSGDVDPEQAPTSYARKYLIEGRPLYQVVYTRPAA